LRWHYPLTLGRGGREQQGGPEQTRPADIGGRAMLKKFVLAAVLAGLAVGGSGTAFAQDQARTAVADKKLDTLYAKVVKHIQAKEYDEAMEVIEEILEIDPNQSDAWALRAVVHNAKGEFKEAVKSGRKSIKIDKTNFVAWFHVGIASFNLKKYEDAQQAFERVIDLKPDVWIAYDNLATSLRAQGKDDEADDVLKTKKQRMAKANKKPTPGPRDDD
jgi:tetratricopeptide (TPR) repeat protein